MKKFHTEGKGFTPQEVFIKALCKRNSFEKLNGYPSLLRAFQFGMEFAYYLAVIRLKRSYAMVTFPPRRQDTATTLSETIVISNSERSSSILVNLLERIQKK